MNSRFKTGVDGPLAEDIVKRLMRAIRQFPKPDTPKAYKELVTEWRSALNFPKVSYPPHVYERAVTSWLSEAKSDSWPPMPGDIIEHCKKVMTAIHDDPVEGPQMREWQEARREARIEKMIREGR